MNKQTQKHLITFLKELKGYACLVKVDEKMMTTAIKAKLKSHQVSQTNTNSVTF